MNVWRPALFCLMLSFAAPLLAQVPSGVHGRNTSIFHYRDTPAGPVKESILSGNDWTPVRNQVFLVKSFDMPTFRNGQTNLIVQAAESFLDLSKGIAWDSGPIKIFTPTTNVFLQGNGFFLMESNRVLIISNNVETRIQRALIKSPLIAGPRTNAPPPGPAQMVTIFSGRGRFDYGSNRAEYYGGVHVIDPQMDLRSDFLFVQLNTNGAIESILAKQNVVITTTNKGRATGDIGRYYITNGTEMLVLTGNAAWHNGDEEAYSGEFAYDSAHHILWGTNHVHVRWPNAAQTAAQRQSGEPPRLDATGAREMDSDEATLQMPPTNGPVESMIAIGNVVITNQADHSQSTSSHAVYSRAENRFELTGAPIWRNERVTIRGQSLLADVTNQIYHALGHAEFETALSSNQSLAISCTNVDYQTNLAVFHDGVRVRLFQNRALRDSLNCDLLRAELLSNEVTKATAIGNVRGETAPDLKGNVDTIGCAVLVAHRSLATLRVTDVEATNHVIITEYGESTNAPLNKLRAEFVRADFFSTTNQIEKATAEHDVILEQFKPSQSIHATAARADYTATNDAVKLTGAPLAMTDKYIISGADWLIWQPKTNRFRAAGWYNIIPAPPKTGHPSSLNR